MPLMGFETTIPVDVFERPKIVYILARPLWTEAILEIKPTNYATRFFRYKSKVYENLRKQTWGVWEQGA
jgi:hypothetical protein